MDGFGGFAFVMVRPKAPGNIGAAARAMKNMGFSDLRLVAPQRNDATRAAAMAVHAADVLEASRRYDDLSSAIADRRIVVGTTARKGPYRSEARPLREAAFELVALASTNTIAILFGPEDFGLTNDDLKSCHRLITIPTSPAYSSLNVAQAALLVAYELRLAVKEDGSADSIEPFASADEVGPMFERLTAALLSIGFLPEDNPDHIMMTLRSMLGRSGIRPRELDVLNGIARQVQWVVDGGHETLAAKRRAGRKVR